MTYSLLPAEVSRLIYDVGVILELETRDFEELTANDIAILKAQVLAKIPSTVDSDLGLFTSAYEAVDEWLTDTSGEPGSPNLQQSFAPSLGRGSQGRHLA